MFVSNRYRANFVVQCRYATWEVPIEKKNHVLLRPFINTFDHFIGGVISYNLCSYLKYHFAISLFRYFAILCFKHAHPSRLVHRLDETENF